MKINDIKMILNVILSKNYSLTDNQLIFINDVLKNILSDKTMINYSLRSMTLEITYDDTKLCLIYYDDFFFLNFSNENIDINYNNDELVLRKYNYINIDDEKPDNVLYIVVGNDVINTKIYQKHADVLYEINDNFEYDFSLDEPEFDCAFISDICHSYNDILEKSKLALESNKKYPIFYRDSNQKLSYIK